MFRLPAIIIAILPALVLSAQELDALHEFTDKKGTKILATLLEVSSDNRTMRIRREDGQEFESQINVLSLDDQQFIKNWMKTAKVASDFRLEVDIEKKSGKTERLTGSSSSYTYEKRNSSFEITIRNLSRETLPPTRLEYVIVWDDQLLIRPTDNGEWNYTNLVDEDSDETNVVKAAGTVEVSPIPFNRDETVTTESVETSRMFLLGELYREDEAYGIMARIVTENGAVLAEKRLGNSKLNELQWSEVVELKEIAKND